MTTKIANLEDATFGVFDTKVGDVHITEVADATYIAESTGSPAVRAQYGMKNTAGEFSVGVDSSGNFSIADGSSVDAGTILAIDSMGRLGIGESNPLFQLDVFHATDNILAEFHSGDAASAIRLRDNSNFAEWSLNSGATTHLAFAGTVLMQGGSAECSLWGGGVKNLVTTSTYSAFLVSSTEIVRVTSTGFGVGTTSPAELLHVHEESDADCVILNRATSATKDAWYACENSGDANHAWHFGRNANGKFFIRHATGSAWDAGTLATRFSIDTNGKIGLGTAAPSNCLVEINQSDASAGFAPLRLRQSDVDKAIVRIDATEAANATNTLSSFTTPGSIVGWARIDVNGTTEWIPRYSAPSA